MGSKKPPENRKAFETFYGPSQHSPTPDMFFCWERPIHQPAAPGVAALSGSYYLAIYRGIMPTTMANSMHRMEKTQTYRKLALM